MTAFTFNHIPGHSAYDHFAAEVIAKASAEGRKSKSGMESAIKRAWRAVQPHKATGPRIDVVRAK